MLIHGSSYSQAERRHSSGQPLLSSLDCATMLQCSWKKVVDGQLPKDHFNVKATAYFLLGVSQEK